MSTQVLNPVNNAKERCSLQVANIHNLDKSKEFTSSVGFLCKVNIELPYEAQEDAKLYINAEVLPLQGDEWLETTLLEGWNEELLRGIRNATHPEDKPFFLQYAI